MSRPPKAVAVLELENRSHRTKAELQTRKAAEAKLVSGKKLRERKEVRDDPIAHLEFRRVVKLLEAIEKNDAIYEPVINRYCILQSECSEFEQKREMFSRNLEALIEDVSIEPQEKYRLQSKMQKNIIDIDKQVQTKRRMLLDIEKECCMTIAAALRNIAKIPEKKENALLSALLDDDD